MVGARVVVAAFGFSQLFIHVGGGLVNRGDDRASGRIRFLADVNGVCGETHVLLLFAAE